MSVETCVVARLKGDGAVAALLGDRIHPDQAPASSEYPCLTYSEADRKTVMCYDGPTLTDRYGLTLQVYGTAKGATKAAARAARACLLGYSGRADGGTFLGVFDTDESDSLDQPLFADERGVYCVTIGLNVWFREVQGNG